MKQLFVCIISMYSFHIHAQITTTKVVSNPTESSKYVYDSTSNFLESNVQGYLGQELYLKGKHKDLQKYGYENMVVDYNKPKIGYGNAYKCCDGVNAQYSPLEGKYFTVLEVIPHPKDKDNSTEFRNISFLKLQERESGDVLYYEYDSSNEYTFPFVIVGFFEKAKKKAIGKKLIFCNETLKSSKDITTGRILQNKTGQKWTCTGLTIEDEFFQISIIIENQAKEKTLIPYYYVFGPYRKGKVYFEDEEIRYKKKFGTENFTRILNTEVVVGMTKEMCELSWGEPKDINETITATSVTEQWVYEDNYLYFTNGKLKTIQ